MLFGQKHRGQLVSRRQNRKNRSVDESDKNKTINNNINRNKRLK